ncbi:MAG: hypothetical protein K2O18_06290, partial [Oscillospiraceae bacterium]|nr:hypothetical protein [Oscillospiraceae bacterium]
MDGTENQPMKGVEFLVTDSSGNAVGPDNGHYYTDKDGRITINNLEPGMTVTAHETKTLDGYVLDGTPQTIQIKTGEVQTLTFWNKKAGNLIVKKIDSDTKKPLAGVEFKITYSDGSFVDQDGGQTSSNGIYVTDTNGEIKITGIVGSIVVAETKPLPGYIADPAGSKTVKINPNDTQTLTFENTKAGGLIVKKMDSVTKKPLAGVEFKITYTDGSYVDLDNGKVSTKGIYQTDKDGEIFIDGITGNVVVTETKTIDGYVIDETNKSQTVQINPNDTQTIFFYNEPLCSLTLTKLDSVTGKPVPDTEFAVKDGNGNVLGRYTTGKDGTVTVTGLIPNSTVVVAETKVPQGYVLNTTPQTIIVKNGTGNSVVSGASSSSGGNDLTFENDPKTTLVIQKFVDGTENQPMKGVEFLVTDSSGNVVGPDNGHYYTDKDGRITINNLEPGMTVTARETKTLDGFVLDGTPQTIQIKTGEVQTLTFWNKKAGNLIVKKMDSVTKKPLANVEFKITYTDGSFVDLDGGKTSTKGIYRTDEDGEILIKGITGNIVVTETKTIDGYVIDETKKSQTVQVNPNDTQTLWFYNEPLCSLTLTKLDSVTGKPVPGTEFTVKDGSGNVLGRYTTGKDGTVTVTGLIPNSTVVVSESKVPQGYVLNTTPQTIIVKNGTGNSVVSGAGSSSSGNDLTFENDPTSTLIIQKFVDGTENEPMKGVEFLVTGSNGEAVGNGQYFTDKDGRITIPNLEPGITVTARETKTLEGYVLDGTPQSIQIKTGAAQVLTFFNQKAGSLTIKKVDSISKAPLAGVQFKVTYADGSAVDTQNGKVSS